MPRFFFESFRQSRRHTGGGFRAGAILRRPVGMRCCPAHRKGGLAGDRAARPAHRGVLPRLYPRPCSQSRPPAIHGRLSAHPLCAERAPACVGFGIERKPTRWREPGSSGCRGVAFPSRPRGWFVPAVDAGGGCPEPAMDGRRPDREQDAHISGWASPLLQPRRAAHYRAKPPFHHPRRATHHRTKHPLRAPPGKRVLHTQRSDQLEVSSVTPRPSAAGSAR